jgi:hypothetical protein
MLMKGIVLSRHDGFLVSRRKKKNTEKLQVVGSTHTPVSTFESFSEFRSLEVQRWHQSLLVINGRLLPRRKSSPSPACRGQSYVMPWGKLVVCESRQGGRLRTQYLILTCTKYADWALVMRSNVWNA